MDPSGQTAAADRWFRQHAAAVRKYAVRRVGPDQAEDIVSEVFSVVSPYRSTLPPDAEALPWIYGIARRVVARWTARESRIARPLASGLAGTTAVEPETAVVGAVWVDELFRQLRPDDAELLRLVAGEDLEPGVAGSVLGISGGAARVRLHRIRKRLQRLLAAESAVETSGGGRTSAE